MARPRVYEEERVTTAVRIPRTTHQRLRAEAMQRDVSVNYLIVRAVERYFEDLPAPEPSSPK
jgi:predicted HicB family RNase H-like nuclease